MNTRTPIATYRLQLTPSFGFERALAVVPYLAGLGVSHLYLSPVFEARAGSTHGYDIIDPTRLRSELGGEAAFVRLSRTAAELGLGLILDIVPNHMAADLRNPWWHDTLRYGPASQFASYFDVEWDSESARRAAGGVGAVGGRVVLPVLGRPLDEAIAAGELRLVEEPEPVLEYLGSRYPVAPGTWLAEPLKKVLDHQFYRLAYWRDAGAAVNYRRFFDINDLVAVRVDDPLVFDATHELVLRLVSQGLVAGVRVDHVDGLTNPAAYLSRLRTALDERAPSGERPLLYVEKILADDEELPPEWPVDGTTGYEFLNDVLRVFVDPAGFEKIEHASAPTLDDAGDFGAGATACKASAATTVLAADLARVARAFEKAFDAAGLVAPDRPTQEVLARSLTSLSASLGVYRTYMTIPPASEPDLVRIARAEEASRARGDEVSPVVLRLLRAEGAFGPDGTGKEPAIVARQRWQQFTGPLAAKGIEDTALYRHISLAALNEVGGHPGIGADPVASFHGSMARRAASGRLPLSATATHDTKRGEDTRMRQCVLSELADRWLTGLGAWEKTNAALVGHAADAESPSAPDRSLAYQSLLGIRPAGATADGAIGERLGAYLVKGAREAKLRTSWLAPDEAYEASLLAFAAGITSAQTGRELGEGVAFHGMLNSLAQTLVKACAPGVPDIYQGTELWDLSLVDPDNRRDVDYDARAAAVRDLKSCPAPQLGRLVGEWLGAWPDGRIKLLVLARALDARRARPGLFGKGEYLPLRVTGSRAGHLLAFARRGAGGACIVLAPRLTSALVPVGTMPLGESTWGDTALELPAGWAPAWTDAITGRRVEAAGGGLSVSAVLTEFPAALLLDDGRAAGG